MKIDLRKDLPRWLTILALLIFFIVAARGMETQDWVITLLRGLSVGSVTFLVASGFSLIFGLLDVLNMAHGTMFMIGAYIAWTVYVRPDTFVDLLTPILLLISGFTLSAVWKRGSSIFVIREAGWLSCAGLVWQWRLPYWSMYCPVTQSLSGMWEITVKARLLIPIWQTRD